MEHNPHGLSRFLSARERQDVDDQLDKLSERVTDGLAEARVALFDLGNFIDGLLYGSEPREHSMNF